jgi:hypothetical protein
VRTGIARTEIAANARRSDANVFRKVRIVPPTELRSCQTLGCPAIWTATGTPAVFLPLILRPVGQQMS